ncbi:MAG: HAF repeat-containing protein [Actinobacteria bacterium]|nr:HAF repeat-containing protein [Actinomycetota bacterium]
MSRSPDGPADIARRRRFAYIVSLATALSLMVGVTPGQPAEVLPRQSLALADQIDARGARPQIRIVDVGTLGGEYVEAAGINDAGAVAGISATEGECCHAFVWSAGRITDLGVPAGYRYSGALALNSSGVVAGYGFNPKRSYRGAVWAAGLATPLGPDDGISTAYALNDRNQAAGYIDLVATLWTSGEPLVLGTLHEDAESIAYGLNNAGQVVGDSYNRFGDHAHHAFIWKGGVLTDLGTLPGGTGASARAINARGHVAGTAFFGTTGRGFLWQDGRITELKGLAGDLGSAAYALNSLDQVVGHSTTALGDWHAVLWRSGTVTDLNDWLPAGSGWVLRQAVGINDAGAIVGNGTLNGHPRAFVLKVGA